MDLTNKAYANVRVLRNLQPEETLYSGGFATTSNITNGDYIFYAIAAIS